MIFYCSIFLFGGYYTLNDRTCHQPPWCALVPGNQVLTIVMVSRNHRPSKMLKSQLIKIPTAIYYGAQPSPRYNKPTSSNIILWGIFIFASITSGTSKRTAFSAYHSSSHTGRATTSAWPRVSQRVTLR